MPLIARPRRNSINGPEGVLAVEMQAASLFAFGVARQASVASVAMVSNAVDHAGPQFDTGSQEDGLRVLKGIARAAPFIFPTASSVQSDSTPTPSTLNQT